MILNGSSYFIFIDDADFSFVPKNKKCRDFVGVTPLALRNLQFDRIFIVAAVVPGDGVIYEWSESKSIRGNHYQSSMITHQYKERCQSKLPVTGIAHKT